MNASLPANFNSMSETEQLAVLERRASEQPQSGKLVERVVTNPLTGAVHFREWTGPKSAWMDQFKSKMWLQIRINKHATGPA